MVTPLQAYIDAVLSALIFFEPKHAQRRRRTEKGSKTKLKRKEEAIHIKKEGTPPLITLNLRSFFVG
ncbi:uncharacterized protein DS421_18g616820 [Arachis hypogaea]|nr:uncharacterized protein DS421_18g616820 [Arachis hypogaea]